MEKKKSNHLSKEEALIRLQKYCVYQDRCHQEVRAKLLELEIFGDDLENIIVDLISEKFLDEERFARSYVRGKFRMKSWGRIRIRQELKKRNISPYCLRKGFEEINEDDYEATLTRLIKKKNKEEREKNEFKRKGKLAQYAMRKGYESHLVWKMIHQIFNKKK